MDKFVYKNRHALIVIGTLLVFSLLTILVSVLAL